VKAKEQLPSIPDVIKVKAPELRPVDVRGIFRIPNGPQIRFKV
jgi:hypothetical protein